MRPPSAALRPCLGPAVALVVVALLELAGVAVFAVYAAPLPELSVVAVLAGLAVVKPCSPLLGLPEPAGLSVVEALVSGVVVLAVAALAAAAAARAEMSATGPTDPERLRGERRGDSGDADMVRPAGPPAAPMPRTGPPLTGVRSSEDASRREGLVA